MDKHTKALAAYYRRVGQTPKRALELAKANSASYTPWRYNIDRSGGWREPRTTED